MNRVPPGYPLGYVLEHHEFLCTGCGHSARFSRMLSCIRAGADNKRFVPTGANETVYDLEISQVTNRITTPRCELCLDTLPKQGVPKLPPLRARLKPFGETLKPIGSLEDLDL